MTRFEVRLADSAKEDIRKLNARSRALVIAAIKKHLTDLPNVQEGDKKILRGLVPPWTQARPVWQLTAVPFRVFYDVDVDAGEVVINAVREKSSKKTTEEIL